MNRTGGVEDKGNREGGGGERDKKSSEQKQGTATIRTLFLFKGGEGGRGGRGNTAEVRKISHH